MNGQTSTALDLTLYVKPGCHLCEDAEAEIAAVGSRYPHLLQRIDINSDADLLRRYWDQIPVLVIDGREYPAPLSRAVIERALMDAAARAGVSPTAPSASAAWPSEAPTSSEGIQAARRNPWSNWRGR